MGTMSYKGLHGATRLTWTDIRKRYPELASWWDEVLRGWSADKYLLILEAMDESPTRLNFYFFTPLHEYRLSIRPPAYGTTDIPLARGYMGGSFKTRAPRPGEDWQRGNDLHDGAYSLETLRSFAQDVLRVELVPLDIQEARAISGIPGTSPLHVPPANPQPGVER